MESRREKGPENYWVVGVNILFRWGKVGVGGCGCRLVGDTPFGGGERMRDKSKYLGVVYPGRCSL